MRRCHRLIGKLGFVKGDMARNYDFISFKVEASISTLIGGKAQKKMQGVALGANL